MHTLDDVFRVVGETGDNFYMTVFMLECWLGQLTNHYVAEYSEKKQAKDRRLQAGIGLRLFDETFRLSSPDEIQHTFECISRFAQHRDGQSQIVFQAFGCMNHDLPFPDASFFEGLPRSEVLTRMVDHTRQFFCRLCEWVEAIIHQSTHVHTWNAPVVFHPDPETREIASVGLLQRRFKALSPESQAYWKKHFDDVAAAHGDKPKWLMLGKAMASEDTKEPHHPDVDRAIILLWPLMKQHNWTYRDLITVLADVLPKYRGYPCEREQDLAAYCPNVLGLRKTGRAGRSKSANELQGLAVARAIFSS
jgi:hypothetical protein